MSSCICALEDLASCHLGYKSLQNHFFYVTKQIIEEYEIEPEYVEPILTMGDVAKNRYVQTGSGRHFLFLCSKSETDLRGTGALRYIRGMSGRPAGRKKQGRRLETIKAALSQQGGTLWYAPKAKPHKSHIWLRKAFDGVFSPFLFKRPVVLDQRCNFIAARRGVSREALAALLTSSVFALSLESCGAASMGAGALEIATGLLRRIPVPDLRLLKVTELARLVSLAEVVWKTEAPVDWAAGDRPALGLEKLDAFVLSAIRKAAVVPTRRLHDDLADTVASRKMLAETKVTSRKASTRRDVGEVASAIASSLRPLLESHRFPEYATERGWPTMSLDLSGHQTLHVRCEEFLGQATVRIEGAHGETLYAEGLPSSVAQVLLKALMTGRRQFALPADEAHAAKVLSQYFTWLPPLLEKVRSACSDSALGTQFQEELEEMVLSGLGVHPRADEPESLGEIEFQAAAVATARK